MNEEVEGAFTNKDYYGYESIQTYIIKLQARVKLVLTELIFYCTRKSMEVPILRFLKQMITPLKFIPLTYLKPSEKARLSQDIFGRIM